MIYDYYDIIFMNSLSGLHSNQLTIRNLLTLYICIYTR